MAAPTTQRCAGHTDPAVPAVFFEWEQTRQGPACKRCDVAWPGHPLPKPAHRVEGYGELAKQKGWNERVRAMTSELQEIEV
jgi:hypothetical protein